MRRSKSGIFVSTGCRRGTTSSTCLRAALATVAPCDDQSEDDVQSAETDAEQCVAERQRCERCEYAEEHEADAHDGDDADGECAAADERRAVEQQPRRR